MSTYKKEITAQDLIDFPELAEKGWQEGMDYEFEDEEGLPHPPSTPIKPPLDEEPLPDIDPDTNPEDEG